MKNSITHVIKNEFTLEIYYQSSTFDFYERIKFLRKAFGQCVTCTAIKFDCHLNVIEVDEMFLIRKENIALEDITETSMLMFALNGTTQRTLFTWTDSTMLGKWAMLLQYTREQSIQKL